MFLHRLLPSVDGIPVLMYHRVWPGFQDGLTVTPEQLEAHLYQLYDKGYRALPLPDFLATVRGARPRRASDLLLTFDDGYRNNLTYAYPLLQRFGFCATIFVIAGTLDGSYRETATGPDEKLGLQDYREMDPSVVQLGLHGYHHENFGAIDAAAQARVLEQSMSALEQSGLPWHKVLAYPYGARPKSAQALGTMKKVLQEAGIEAAFRIGNRPERVPSADLYEIRRIDIRGEDDVRRLALKVRKGKLKLF